MEGQVIRVRRKGQITLPAEIRRDMGIDEGDKVVLTRENGKYALAAFSDVVDSTAGALAEYAIGKPPIGLDDIHRAIDEAMMENYLRKLARERSPEEIEAVKREVAEGRSEYEV
ncbi:MAG: AbrB/MazE/SpoVT family DNA-binding domain-containing protein [Thermomicrobiales bacterium]|nr:AbrB/MazE/SpoVT family DNA-binding domain-containing protein [Thermomicrobiales bacterium]MCO5226323.1 AbrB/MazE/SpoVT family DNA-binding domain-containing protein [Thermomicrobiales bacterium]MCO5228833.1 AbrB/MazE/SpoVT family DNA-binding domain-containing protein [Thermomicrobiales bacterium]